MKNFLKAILFIAVFILLAEPVNEFFIEKGMNTLMLGVDRNLFSEPKDSADAVLVGASSLRVALQPPLVYKSYGWRILSVTHSDMNEWALKYMTMYARKTQPDALYIYSFPDLVRTNRSNYNGYYNSFHSLPLSAEKIGMIFSGVSYSSRSYADYPLFLFPLLRFHSRWNLITPSDFTGSRPPVKGADIREKFWKNEKDLRDTPASPFGSQQDYPVLRDLLNYLASEHVNALFILPAQLGRSSKFSEGYRQMIDLIEAAGYPVYKDWEEPEALNISAETDFYDPHHINIHGSIKFMNAFAGYLEEHYGFTDHRGESGNESWEKAVEIYDGMIRPYITDFEFNNAARDYTLAEPAVTYAVNGDTVTLSWEAVDGADSYDIYSRNERRVLTRLGNTKALNFAVDAADCDYAVIPVRGEGNNAAYGSYAFTSLPAEDTES